MPVELREMTIDDHAEAVTLWQATEGLILDAEDSPEAIARYLDRNPGLSFVAIDEGTLVGTILCGHDGRRGMLRHLAVKATHRSQGIARGLIAKCLEGLRRQGIAKCNAFVLEDNEEGQAIWERLGFAKLERRFCIMQTRTDGPAD